MILKLIIGTVVVLVCMYLVVRLVKYAAVCLMGMIFAGACIYAVIRIYSGDWSEWPELLGQCALTGLVAALLVLPVLPFTNFNRPRK